MIARNQMKILFLLACLSIVIGIFYRNIFFMCFRGYGDNGEADQLFQKEKTQLEYKLQRLRNEKELQKLRDEVDMVQKDLAERDSVHLSETRPKKKRLTDNKEDYIEDTADLSQIFVPDGKRYNAMEGIIYDCMTKNVHSAKEPPKQMCDFRSFGYQGEDPAARAKSFQDVFEKQTWFDSKEKTPTISKSSSEFRASGQGSSLEETNYTIALLDDLVTRLKIGLKKAIITIVDVPCGDFYWMRHFVRSRTDIQYTGIDIVPALIERHKINFKNMTHATFENHDIVTAGLNKSYDVIFCRDLLQHLTNADALKVLEHFSNSGCKLLVTTNYLWNENAAELDLRTGRYRHINLMLPPVNLIPPLCSTRDEAKKVFKELAVWKLPLRQKNC